METLGFSSLKTSSHQAALAGLELSVDHAATQYRSTHLCLPSTDTTDKDHRTLHSLNIGSRDCELDYSFQLLHS